MTGKTHQDWIKGQTSPHMAEAMYEPEKWRRADQIAVREFREILIWPLALESGDPVAATIDHLARSIEADNASPWRRIHDPMDHIEPAPANTRESLADQAQLYAEFVYFHDFIQQFLYQKQGAATPPFYLFQRNDIHHVLVTLSDGVSLRLDIERLNLYLFSFGVAFVVIEAASCGIPLQDGGKLTLDTVQTFMDEFRRAYAPFWFVNGETASAGYSPARVAWLDGNGEEILGGPHTEPSFDQEFDKIRHCKEKERHPSLFSHWDRLLDPLCLKGMQGANKHAKNAAVWRHIVDERIPFMSYISLASVSGGEGSPEDLKRISRGDWMRLCFADRAGSDPLPYNPFFLRHFETDQCYDRFFPHAGSQNAVRHMFSGYAYCAVGAGWFCDNHLNHHFRRHYFQMALLAHMEFAALLSFSSRITRAVTALQKNGDEKNAYETFQNTILGIEKEFLDFTHRYRFTAVSNQVQAIELYGMWRKHLRLQDISDDLSRELKDATDFIFANDQDIQTKTGNYLNIVATIGVALGLPMAFLGMNIVTNGTDPTNGIIGDASQWASFFVVVLFFQLAALLYLYWTVENKQQRERRTFRNLYVILGINAAISAFLAVALELDWIAKIWGWIRNCFS